MRSSLLSVLLVTSIRLCSPSPCTDCEAEEGALLQVRNQGGSPHSLIPADGAGPERISIGSDGALLRGSERVVPLGGNYVVKAQPYFVPLDVVRANAKSMAAGARAMKFKPSDGRTVVPCVRLGALFEAAMPESPGKFDPKWSKQLDATIEAFASEGVYVFLDAHQDALSTTNGGEGFPAWVAKHMQESDPHTAYSASTQHPLETIFSDFIGTVASALGIEAPRVTTEEGAVDPWRNYSLGANAGDPRFMNIGNRNMRLNNNDEAWSAGILPMTRQVQNYAQRLYDSPWSDDDKEVVFEAYAAFILELCRAWERHSNVIAVEFMNEPPIAGLPSVWSALRGRRKLFDFYAAVLEKLDEAQPPVRAPVALEDLGGGASGANPAISVLFSYPRSYWALKRLKQWGQRKQLMFAFHFYPGIAVTKSMPEMIKLAREAANRLNSNTTFFSEYWTDASQSTADILAEATELGVDATTYWHYVDSTYTHTEGWYIYPSSVGNEGSLFDGAKLNSQAWAAYAPTVADGTFWGAEITGANGGKMDVLELVPRKAPKHDQAPKVSGMKSKC